MRPAVPLIAAAIAACAPPLDWREVRPAGTGAVVLFPCKPTQEARRVRLAGVESDMVLLACQADGITWALAHADVGDPARVNPALDELSSAAMRNISAAAPASAPAGIPGSTPNPRAALWHAEGKRPDGTAVHADTAVFARGTRVFQATVLAPRPAPGPSETFIGSIRWP